MADIKTYHVIISGRVQGVGYRAWCAGTAQDLGLTGWVRNRTDGTVEAVFCGTESVVEKMLDACEDGPIPAQVESVISQESHEAIDNKGFITKHTI